MGNTFQKGALQLPQASGRPVLRAERVVSACDRLSALCWCSQPRGLCGKAPPLADVGCVVFHVRLSELVPLPVWDGVPPAWTHCSRATAWVHRRELLRGPRSSSPLGGPLVWKLLPRDGAEGHATQPCRVCPRGAHPGALRLDGYCFLQGRQRSVDLGWVFIKLLWMCSVAVTKKVAFIPWTDVNWAVIVGDEESLWPIEKRFLLFSHIHLDFLSKNTLRMDFESYVCREHRFDCRSLPVSTFSVLCLIIDFTD